MNVHVLVFPEEVGVCECVYAYAQEAGAHERVCMEDMGAAAAAAVDEAFFCTGRQRAGVLGYSPSS